MVKPCSTPTRDELRAIRVERARALKAALDADAGPGAVLSGMWTAWLFAMANNVPEEVCAGVTTGGGCR